MLRAALIRSNGGRCQSHSSARTEGVKESRDDIGADSVLDTSRGKLHRAFDIPGL